MKLLATLLAFTMIGSVACKDKKETVETTTTTSEKKEVVMEKADPAKDSVEIRKLIVDFYSWYNSNYKKLMGYNLYSSLKKNDGAPYKLNWDAVKKYQDFIRDSIPQLGEEFLANQKRMFEKADSAFKVDFDSDVPAYFDYDWYTNSQEDPSYLLDGINKSQKWITNVKGNEASVEIGAPADKNYIDGSLLLYVSLKKENGQWTIAKIGND